MGLFRKKKTEVPEGPKEEPLPDDAGWRRWAERGFQHLADNDMYGAVSYWTQTIDRFSDEPRFYTKFHNDVVDKIAESMMQHVAIGKIIPTHIIAELDVEAYLKQHDIRGSLFCDDVFYYVKEHVTEAAGPTETVMMFLCGAYAMAGYLRFSPDLRESAERCEEVVRLGNYCSEHCMSFKRGTYKSHLKPKVVNEFIESTRDFYGDVGRKLTEAADAMTEEELLSLIEYRREHFTDRLAPFSSALQASIESVRMSYRSRQKTVKNIDELIDDFVKMFIDMSGERSDTEVPVDPIGEELLPEK